MMTRGEIYGGAVAHEYLSNGEVYTVEDRSRKRVYYMFADDGIGPFNFVLPDPESLYHPGGIAFFVYNNTDANISVKNTNGEVLVVLASANNECAEISLVDATASIGGEWAVIHYSGEHENSPITSRTISFGGIGAPNADQCDSYRLETDAWTNETDLPIPSGSPEFTTAASHHDGSSSSTFFGFHTNFYSWALGTSTAKDPPLYQFLYTGLSYVAAHVSGELFHIGNDTVDVANSTELYHIGTDTWTNGPAFAFFVQNPPEQTRASSNGYDAVEPFTYINISTPNDAEIVRFRGSTSSYSVATTPIWPWGHFAPSMVGIRDLLHVRCGGMRSDSTVNYSDDHYNVHLEAFSSWFIGPGSPIAARGMGVSDNDRYRDRYTFGMGAGAGHPGTPTVVHYEYNTFTRSYTDKATFPWGDRDRREGAWAPGG